MSRRGRDEPDAMLDDDRLTLAGLFAESFTGLRSQLDRRLVQDCGLPLQWFVLLLRLARSPDQRLRMSDLADQTSLTPSGLTRAIDRLSEAGLVRRMACPSDRRGAFAALTPKGLRRVTGAVEPHLHHLDDAFVSLLTGDERQQLATILRKVRDHVNPGAARPPEPIPDPVDAPREIA
jgi:MarR family transcriptional regulator, 2-MHQ and catechol-resistance regulon repressor